MNGPARDGDLGSILAVFAHPDDEAYLAGALMAKAVDEGRRVVCVTATRGERGFPDDDPRSDEERAAVRTAEMEACLAVLGVREHVWLDLPDGGSAQVDEDEPVGRLVEIIDDVRPDTTLTFGPDGQTFHVDHQAISRWTTAAVSAAAHRTRLLYAAMTPGWIEAFADEVVPLDQVMMEPGRAPVTTPEHELAVAFAVEGDLLDRKVRALRSQASQIEPIIAQAGLHGFSRLVAVETYRHPDSSMPGPD